MRETSTLLVPEPVQSRPRGAPWASVISVAPDSSGSEAASTAPVDGSGLMDRASEVPEEDTGEAGADAVSEAGAKAQSGSDGSVRAAGSGVADRPAGTARVPDGRAPLVPESVAGAGTVTGSGAGSGVTVPRPVERGTGAGSVRGASPGAVCWTGRASCQTSVPCMLPTTAESRRVSTGCPESPAPDRSAGKSVHHTVRPSPWAIRWATSPASAGGPENARTTGVVRSLRISGRSFASRSRSSPVGTPAVSPS
ncbi:hypothetical protein EES45_08465 [Streptomyces sp. ADI97-07]|nr:hypothetical protein EES45_08465 [Streptomyces sp. ADI97-07]